MNNETMFLNDLRSEIKGAEYREHELASKLEKYQDDPVWDLHLQEWWTPLRANLTEDEFVEAERLYAQLDELHKEEETLRKLKRRFQKMFGL